MSYQIVAVSGQPDLAFIVANWLVNGFGHSSSRTLQDMTLLILAPPRGPEETFVLFDQDMPVGTARLAHDDLVSRPDLTPWLAGVFVEPAFRGQGYGTALVQQVEAFAAAAFVKTLWLYTWTAEPLYARLGWHRVGLEKDKGQDVVLMTRALSNGHQTSDFIA